MRRRVLMVGRTRYALPLSPSLAAQVRGARRRVRPAGRRRRAVGERPRRRHVLPAARSPVRALDAPAFYGSLPVRIARELRSFRPDAIVAQSPYEALAALAARALARSDAAVVVEIHGDWRHVVPAVRLAAAASREPCSPIARRPWVVRRADAVRTLSPFTEGIVRDAGVEPTMSFTTYTELTAFSEPALAPLPDAADGAVRRRPRAIQEHRRHRRGLEARGTSGARTPSCVWSATGVTATTSRLSSPSCPEQTEWVPRLETPDVVKALDDAWCLLLVSRSEGTPRVVLEALCRGRAVIGSRGGGIPDVVRDGETGLIVDTEDRDAIADALVRLLSDRLLAERLGEAGHAWSSDWTYTPEEYAARMAELVERAIAQARARVRIVFVTQVSRP